MRNFSSCVIALLLSAPPTALGFEVIVEPLDPLPGDIIRVEIRGMDNPSRARCEFSAQAYPLFPVGPGRMRALIGLTARLKPSGYEVIVTRKRFMLPDEKKTLAITVSPREFTHQSIQMPEKKTQLAAKPEAKTAMEVIRGMLAQRTRRQFWRGAFLRPAQGRRTSSYGHTRTINSNMAWDWHKGVDIAAADGHPVMAPNGGRIVLTGRYPVQGGTVILDHGQGLMSAFLHLSAFDVEVGDEVRKGEKIASVGGEGFSTGSHLHWGVYVHGDSVDPERLLEREF